MKKEHDVINGKGQVKCFLQNAADPGEKVYTDYIGYFWTNNFSKNTLFKVFWDAKKNHCCS